MTYRLNQNLIRKNADGSLNMARVVAIKHNRVFVELTDGGRESFALSWPVNWLVNF